MTRGDQRERARLKHDKKVKSGPKESLDNKSQRMNRDADIMRQKNEAAAARKAEEDALKAADEAQKVKPAVAKQKVPDANPNKA